MTWFKIDDTFPMNPKVLQCSLSAIGLWALAGAWSCQQLTDGEIPAGVITGLRRDTDDANELVVAGLWEEIPAGYRFHDWDEYQPSAREVKEKRRKRAEAGRLGGQKSAEKRANEANGQAKLKQNPSKTQAKPKQNSSKIQPRPDPTRPDPTRPDSNTPYSPPKGDTENTPPDVTSMFNKFWDAFPKERKRAKSQCLELFKKLAKTGQDLEAIVTAAEQYRDDPNRQPRYTVNPYTWLREERWEAGPLPGNGPTGSRVDEWIQAGRDVQAQLRQVGS